MKFCRGQYILMVDADGATEISEYERLFKELGDIKNTNNEAFVVGSRNIIMETKKAEVKFPNNCREQYIENY